jgi:hypothetical protein
MGYCAVALLGAVAAAAGQQYFGGVAVGGV